MDVVGQRTRYRVPDPAHSVVLQHLLERVDECSTSLGDYALVIADEVDGQARHRADLSSYREVGTTGYRRRKLTRIVDTLHFAPSHTSRLVQAADVITFLYRRVFTHRETDERSRKAKIAMWNRLRPRVHHEPLLVSVNKGRRTATPMGPGLPVDAQRARKAGSLAGQEIRGPSRRSQFSIQRSFLPPSWSSVCWDARSGSGARRASSRDGPALWNWSGSAPTAQRGPSVPDVRFCRRACVGLASHLPCRRGSAWSTCGWRTCLVRPWVRY